MRSLRLAYIVALTFLLSVTVALGQVAFYPSPTMPKASSASFLKGSASYGQDYTSYQDDLKVHTRNQFIVSLVLGVVLVVAGVIVAMVSTTIGSAMVFSGAITFSFGQFFLFTANLGSLASSFMSSTGSSGFSIDLALEFFAALIGTIVLLALGLVKFREEGNTATFITPPFEPGKSIRPDALPPQVKV